MSQQRQFDEHLCEDGYAVVVRVPEDVYQTALRDFRTILCPTCGVVVWGPPQPLFVEGVLGPAAPQKRLPTPPATRNGTRE